jgi:hypothetical protein
MTLIDSRQTLPTLSLCAQPGVSALDKREWDSTITTFETEK